MSADANEERSIKARTRLIFDDEPVVALPNTSRKPFTHYLRQTPPTPLSPMTKMFLCALGVAVLLLFIGSIVKGSRPKEVKKSSMIETAATVRSLA